MNCNWLFWIESSIQYFSKSISRKFDLSVTLRVVGARVGSFTREEGFPIRLCPHTDSSVRHFQTEWIYLETIFKAGPQKSDSLKKEISHVKGFSLSKDVPPTLCCPPSNWTKLPLTEFLDEVSVLRGVHIFPTEHTGGLFHPPLPAFLGVGLPEWMRLVTRHLFQHHGAFPAKILSQTISYLCFIFWVILDSIWVQ